MHDCSHIGKKMSQTSANGSEYLTKHFQTENELFIPKKLIYPFVHRQTFYINKMRLDRSCTEIGTNSK